MASTSKTETATTKTRKSRKATGANLANISLAPVATVQAVEVIQEAPEKQIDFQAIGLTNKWVASKSRYEKAIEELRSRLVYFTGAGILLGVLIGLELAKLA